MWYYFENKLDHYIYIYIYIYIQSDTWDTQYYVKVSIQGVSHTKCNVNYINKSSSMQKEQ